MNSIKKITLILLFILPGCFDESPHYAECVKIEKARCELNQRCDKNFNADDCSEFYYEEQCRARKIPLPFTEDQLETCIADIDALGSVSECKRLDELNGEAETCVFAELQSCGEFLCTGDDDNSSIDTSASGEDSGADTDVPSGLDPK